MKIPAFSPTDHYEYKKWSQQFMRELKNISQNLYDILREEKRDQIRIANAMAAADENLQLLQEAPQQLPPNLAAALNKSSEMLLERLKKNIDDAKKALEVSDA